MILETLIRVDNEDEALAAVGKPFSSDHPNIVCTRISREQDHPIAQARPAPRPDPKDPRRTIQDPAPDPLPGKATWVLHYEPDADDLEHGHAKP